MTHDQAIRRANELTAALGQIGIFNITSSQALKVVAELSRSRDEVGADTDEAIGSWNGVQVAIHASYPADYYLPVIPGEKYDRCGDALFVALMDVGGSQRVDGVIKTFEGWARGLDILQTRAHQQLLGDAPASDPIQLLPDGLTPAFVKCLQTELFEVVDSWLELAGRLEPTRRAIYVVLCSLLCRQAQPRGDVMVLDGVGGIEEQVAVRVPMGMIPATAREVAARLIEELRGRERQTAFSFFALSEAEVKVKLFQAGFAPIGLVYGGPAWRDP